MNYEWSPRTCETGHSYALSESCSGPFLARFASETLVPNVRWVADNSVKHWVWLPVEKVAAIERGACAHTKQLRLGVPNRLPMDVNTFDLSRTRLSPQCS